MNLTPIEQRLTAAERRLVEALSLRPVALPPRLAQARGLWKDAPVTIATRAYEGDSVSYLRVALVSGIHLSIGSLLAQARPNRAVPVLGAEVVSLDAQQDTQLLVDLTPMRSGPGRDADEQAIAALLPATDLIPDGDELPVWCRARCSRQVLHARIGAARLAPVLAIVDRHVDAWMALDAAAVPRPDLAPAIRDHQHAYAAARRADRAPLERLGVMFGRAWADDYTGGVLFPDRF